MTLFLDFVSLPIIYANGLDLSVGEVGFAVVGISTRIAILAVLLMNKGPLEPLVYMWGGLFIIAGGTGLLSLLMTSDPTTIVQYLDKGLHFILGMLLVVPVGESIRYIEHNR